MRYLKCLISVVLPMFILSCSTMKPSIDSDVLVKLKRTACLGQCPIYSVVVKKNGELTYDGSWHVFVEGVKSKVLSKESLVAIEAELIKADFFELTSLLHPQSWGCLMPKTDQNYIIIESRVGNKVKAVSTYTGCDSEQVRTVRGLADEIDKITGIAQWIKESPAESP